ncbi:hypothetical protein J3E68DRAFT_317042 [Trichoderma sp. SZMC 28012]
MEYIWTRPLMEKSPTTLGADRRVSIASSCFGSLSLLFSKLILFFLLLFFCPSYHRRTRRFFFCPFCYFVPFLRYHLLLQNSFFLSFMTPTYIPLYQTWNQKKKAARRGGFFFLSPFFRLRSTVFFSSLCFLFFHFFFGGRTERRGGPNVYVCELLR